MRFGGVTSQEDTSEDRCQEFSGRKDIKSLRSLPVPGTTAIFNRKVCF